MDLDAKTLLIAAAAALLVWPAVGLPHASAQLPQTVTYCQDSVVVSGQSIPEEEVCVSAYVGPPESDPICGDACVPAGAVLAFDLVACPTGWTAFSAAAGRNVIGVGVGGSGLTTRTLGQTGGEETHALTTSEMPAHTHTVPMAIVYGGHTSGGMPYQTDYTGGTTSTTSVGGGSAHNVMDPFVALLYCKKL